LLDYATSTSTVSMGRRGGGGGSRTTTAEAGVNVDINTQFLSPLAEGIARTGTPREGARGNLGGSVDDGVRNMQAFEEHEGGEGDGGLGINWEALGMGMGLSDEPGILFPVELWTNGQL
jgi:hypothetical protein